MSANQHTTSARTEIKIGGRFGRLVVIDGPVVEATPTVRRPHRKTTKFKCECDCGNIHSVSRDELRPNGTQSCGCLRQEAMAATARAHNFRHGHAGRDEERTPEYNVWIKLRKRCLNSKDKDFHKYGARGITVCDEWKDSFAVFYQDMGPRPSSAHSIERKDNDGPYAPWNCRWATAKEQAENRRNNVYLEHNGRRLTLMEWSRVTGIGITTLSYRIKAGWPTARVLTTSNDAYHTGRLHVVRSNSVYLEHDGKNLPQAEWARITGIPRRIIVSRLRAGWSVSDALTRPVK